MHHNKQIDMTIKHMKLNKCMHQLGERNMHKSNIFFKNLLPLFVNHQQRGQNKNKTVLSPLCEKQKNQQRGELKSMNKRYMWYKFMKRRDVKLTPPCIHALHEKEWLNSNPYKHNIQCIDEDVKHPYTRVPYKEKRSSFSLYKIHSTWIYI